MSELKTNTATSLEKLPRVLFNGLNYTDWLNEAKGAGFSAFFDVSVAEAIRDFPSSTELTLNQIQGKLSPLDKDCFNLLMNTALKNAKALLIATRTLEEQYHTVIQDAKLAFDAIKLIKNYWNQSTVTQREVLKQKLEAMKMKEGDDTVLFLIQCKKLNRQLADCGDTVLTDTALAEKVLGKLPDSMEDLANQIRTNATMNHTSVTCDTLQTLFQLQGDAKSHKDLKNVTKNESETPPVASDANQIALIAKLTQTVKALMNQLNVGSSPKNKNHKHGCSGETCENCGKEGHSKSECWATRGGAVANRLSWYKPQLHLKSIIRGIKVNLHTLITLI